MTFVSLFAGIGGIDLGLERAGHECVGQVEIDAYCRKVLAKHWPDVPRIADVRDFEGHEFGPFDMLMAGYPCQPFSYAGRRGGDTDERHLWPEVHRIIRRVRPRQVLLENVPGHLALGFGRVQGDLAESGYDAEWDCIPAAAVGAPHLRDRVFIVAHARVGWGPNDELRAGRSEFGRDRSDVAYAGSEQELVLLDQRGEKRSEAFASQWSSNDLDGYCRSVGRAQWGAEPDVGRVVDGISHRVDRLRALGNAVVPQVAEFIGRRFA